MLSSVSQKHYFCHRKRVESRLLPCEKSVDGTFQYIRQQFETNTDRKYLFFDEIQELPGWEELINALLIDFDVDIYITGSNAKLLSGELAAYLGGRYVEIKIYPFSFHLFSSFSFLTIWPKAVLMF